MRGGVFMLRNLLITAGLGSLFTFLLISFSGNGINGCCSHHYGVNCYAGADPKDGSVICCDGWTGSSCDWEEFCNFLDDTSLQ